MSKASDGRRAVWIWVFYLVSISVAVGAFLVVQRLGTGLGASPAAVEGTGGTAFNPLRGGEQGKTLLHVLVALPVIIIAARVVGAVFRRVGQPAVVGEVVAGIMLGPSLLGRVWPEGMAFVLPGTTGPILQVIAQIGVILFMFLVGLELNASRLRRETHATVAISHASIIVPFTLGSALALWLYPRFATSDVPFTVFALFVGVSMSVTAFPVLARILTDRGMQNTPLGRIALTCAAVDDVSAWCLLAFVVSIARARAGDAAMTVGLLVAFLAVMLLVVRPAMGMLVRRAERNGRVSQDVIAVLVVALLLSALATEAIGIHALFGSFLLGAIISHDSLVAQELTRKLNDLVVILFLPVFFAYTGLRTQIGLLSGVGEWAVCGVIVAVACLGKFGGSAAAARFTGLKWRDAASLGALMNTRGLMELIVLNVGLDMGVLGPKLFAMLVIMAVVTTVMTSPVLGWLGKGEGGEGKPLVI